MNNASLRKEIKRLQKITGAGNAKRSYLFSAIIDDNGVLLIDDNGVTAEKRNEEAEEHLASLKTYKNIRWNIIPDDLDSIPEYVPIEPTEATMHKQATKQKKKEKKNWLKIM